jgi:hypothetical protein
MLVSCVRNFGVQDSVTKKQRATSQKPEETGVPVTVEARKAEEGAARRVDDRERVRKAQRGFKGAFEELIFEIGTEHSGKR